MRCSDTFGMAIHNSGNHYTIIPSTQYYSADPVDPLPVYDPPDIRWHVLSGILSQYYLRYYRILGLNGVADLPCNIRIRRAQDEPKFILILTLGIYRIGG